MLETVSGNQDYLSNSEMVRACEDAWRDIQMHNPDVPRAMIIVGSGGRQAPTLYGHFAPDRWASEGASVHEVLLVAEHLNRGAEAVFTTLLHESVHGIAVARGIKDCSGKRHNKRFAGLCLEVGLVPPEKPSKALGFSAATLSYEAVHETYPGTIANLDSVLRSHRKLTLNETEKKKTSWKAECQCGVSIRVGKKLYDGFEPILAILCNFCDSQFVVQDDDI
jgi:hypothetical protein